MPQVQTIRELLDRGCIGMVATPERLSETLESLKKAPDVIITDSEVFELVYPQMPEESKLTSFSILFAGYKGDLSYFMESAQSVEKLAPTACLLIAEACTHAQRRRILGQ